MDIQSRVENFLQELWSDRRQRQGGEKRQYAKKDNGLKNKVLPSWPVLATQARWNCSEIVNAAIWKVHVGGGRGVTYNKKKQRRKEDKGALERVAHVESREGRKT